MISSQWMFFNDRVHTTKNSFPKYSWAFRGIRNRLYHMKFLKVILCWVAIERFTHPWIECIKSIYLVNDVSYKKYMIVVKSMIDESYLSFIHSIIITSTREATAIKTIKTINFNRDNIAMWSQFIYKFTTRKIPLSQHFYECKNFEQ